MLVLGSILDYVGVHVMILSQYYIYKFAMA